MHRGRGDAEPGDRRCRTRTTVGFASVQLGYGEQRLRRESKKGETTPRGRRAHKAVVGHADEGRSRRRAAQCSAASASTTRGQREREDPDLQRSATWSTVDIFAPGEQVKVTGTSKGRGFQGVVKRYGFGGGPNTHGNTKHRRPGSIGPGTDPSRVIKGKKMPGHYGAERHTQTHLRVEKIDAERNLIYIRGSVAGPTNGIVLVKKQG